MRFPRGRQQRAPKWRRRSSRWMQEKGSLSASANLRSERTCLRPDPRSHTFDPSTSAQALQLLLSGHKNTDCGRGGECSCDRAANPHAKNAKARSALRRAAASHGRVAHRAEEQRPVQRVQMRQQRGNLGQERVAQDRGNLFVAAAAGVANQLAHFHPQRRAPAAPANPASGSPCRFRFWRCRCAAPASGPPVGAGSDGAPGASRAPAQPPAARPRRCRAPAGWSPVAAPGAPAPQCRGVCGTFCKGSCWFGTASACSIHTAPLRVFPRSLKKSPFWMCGVPEQGLRVHRCTAIGATFNEVNHNCQVEI